MIDDVTPEKYERAVRNLEKNCSSMIKQCASGVGYARSNAIDLYYALTALKEVKALHKPTPAPKSPVKKEDN